MLVSGEVSCSEWPINKGCFREIQVGLVMVMVMVLVLGMIYDPKRSACHSPYPIAHREGGVVYLIVSCLVAKQYDNDEFTI